MGSRAPTGITVKVADRWVRVNGTVINRTVYIRTSGSHDYSDNQLLDYEFAVLKAASTGSGPSKTVRCVTNWTVCGLPAVSTPATGSSPPSTYGVRRGSVPEVQGNTIELEADFAGLSRGVGFILFLREGRLQSWRCPASRIFGHFRVRIGVAPRRPDRSLEPLSGPL